MSDAGCQALRDMLQANKALAAVDILNSEHSHFI